MFHEDMKGMDKITMTLEPLSVCAGLKDAGYKSIKDIVRKMMKTKSKKFIFLFCVKIINRLEFLMIFLHNDLAFQ